jgi:hypothetical protein
LGLEEGPGPLDTVRSCDPRQPQVGMVRGAECLLPHFLLHPEDDLADVEAESLCSSSEHCD